MGTFLALILFIFVLVQRNDIKRLNTNIKKILQKVTKLEAEVEILKNGEKVQEFDPTELDELDDAIIEKKVVQKVMKTENKDTIIMVQKEKKVEPKPSFFEKNKHLFTVESIITKLGILLLLVSIGYLFKLAYDYGYITEHLFIILGYIIGIGFIAVGYYTTNKGRDVLGLVLYGGSIATFYITTFAAYVGYELINSFFAMAIMITTTLFAMYFSYMINRVEISLIGIIGGILTPFIVGLDYFGLIGVGFYLVFLSTLGMGLYLLKHWKVLYASVVGSIILVTLFMTQLGDFTLLESQQYALLVVVLYFLFFFTEYYLSYIKKSSTNEIFSSITIGTLTFVSFQELVLMLDLTSKEWAIFSMIWFLFFGAFGLHANKLRKGILSHVILSLSTLFLLLSITLFFENEVHPITLIGVGILYAYLSSKKENIVIYVSSIVFVGFGLLSALTYLIDTIDDLTFFVPKLIISLMLIASAYMYKNDMRKIVGTVSIYTYILASLTMFLMEILSFTYEFSLVVIILNVIAWTQYYFYKKLEILVKEVLVVTLFIPIIIQLTFFLSMDESIINLIIFGFNAMSLYVLSMFDNQYFKQIERDIIRIASYLSIVILTLINIPSDVSYYGYGVLVLGGLLLLNNEKVKSKLIETTETIISIVFLAAVLMFGVISIYSLNYLHLVIEAIIVVISYFILKRVTKEEFFSFIGHSLLYFIYIFKHFEQVNDGVVTILLVFYVLGFLTYFVSLGKEKHVQTTLVMIIIVAIKMILIDLQSVAVIWKIITTMIFGASLLGLSYFLNPIIERNKNEKSS